MSNYKSKLFLFKFLIFLLNPYFSLTQFKYFETLSTDFSALNTTYSTVVVSESKDLGECSCDLTPGTCDYLCCCDTECPTAITTTWVNDPNNVCLDKKGKENDYLTQCFNENILFHFNRKRGMREYRDPVSNLFCVTFDNSSIMGQFYKDITTLSKSTIDKIYQDYVDAHFKSYYYSAQQTSYAFSYFFYEPGQYIRANATASSNEYIFGGKFFLYQSGAFGECVKTNAVKFFTPIDKSTCGMILKPFNTCASKSWDKLINKDLTFASTPIVTPTFLNLQIGNVLLRDYSTGALTVANKEALDPTTMTQNVDECTCNNVLEQAEFNFLIDSDVYALTAVYVNLILGTNIKHKCTEKYIMTQTYSSSFLGNVTDGIYRSGAPGYITGKRLLIGYNRTTTEGVLQFTVPKEGTYIKGRNEDGTCSKLVGGTYTLSSSFDSPIQFGFNSIYSCIEKMTLTQFQTFCENKLWKEMVLFNFVKEIQYVGVFGNADYKFLLDWYQVLVDFNLENSSWDATTNSCNMPSTVFLDVLISKAGAINNPQNYVVSARVSVKYDTLSYLGSDPALMTPFTFRFVTNFVPLTESQLNATRENPTIIPLLPSDIASPLVEAL